MQPRPQPAPPSTPPSAVDAVIALLMRGAQEPFMLKPGALPLLRKHLLHQYPGAQLKNAVRDVALLACALIKRRASPTAGKGLLTMLEALAVQRNAPP